MSGEKIDPTRTCPVCGGPIEKRNKTGVCRKTAECRTESTRLGNAVRVRRKKRYKKPTNKVRLPGSGAVIPQSHCFFWRCEKPPEHRGYCDQHYRQLLRAGELVPYLPSLQPKPRCMGTIRTRRGGGGYHEERCQRASQWKGLCKRCYNTQYRRDNIEAVRERDRNRKRAKHGYGPRELRFKK